VFPRREPLSAPRVRLSPTEISQLSPYDVIKSRDVETGTIQSQTGNCVFSLLIVRHLFVVVVVECLCCRRGSRPSYNSGLSFLPERDYVTFGSLLSQIRLSSVCLSVTLVHPTQRVEAFGNISYRCVRWPSSDLRAKFYGDSPRGTPPSGELNARGVSK